MLAPIFPVAGVRQCCTAAALVLVLGKAALAQGPLTSTYQLHEQRRRAAIADQIGTQEHLRWLNGLPSRIAPGWPYSLESVYAGLAPWQGDMFEPWPLVPGDIYGRQYDDAIQQPLGHVVRWYGPNAYTYEPYYAQPLPPPKMEVAPRPVPQVAPRPAPPPVEEIPPPSGHEDLREF